MASKAAPMKILVYVLRRDLRFVDNPVLTEISRVYQSKSSPFTHLLPIYVFPAHQFEVSGFIPGENGPSKPKSPYPEARSAVAGFWRCGPHRAKFVAESVWDLKNTLEQKGSRLLIRVGSLTDVLRDLFRHTEEQSKTASDSAPPRVTAVWMTRDDGFEERQEEDAIRKLVEESGRDFRYFSDEKYYVDEKDLPFRRIQDLPDVYTTFRKSVEPLRDIARLPLPDVTTLPPLPPDSTITPQFEPFQIPINLPDLISALLKPLDLESEFEKPPRWPDSITASGRQTQSAHPFHGGESEGRRRLDYLLASGTMTNYKETRNGLVGPDFSTKLSAYLAIGCITARHIAAEMSLFEDGEIGNSEWDGTREEKLDKLKRWKGTKGFGKGENAGTAGVRFELLWRDYFRLVQRKYGAKLYALQGLRGKKDKVWSEFGVIEKGDTRQKLMRFCVGRTGLGLIDAAQRELFLTGYSSNRARQNVASFLAKHLSIDWRLGAEWFECMLVDYDAANNWGNWQYVAGVGNDPREGRLFNPVKQALDYDAKGDYIKTWVPELRDVNIGPKDNTDGEKLMGLFQPWRLPAEEKQRLGLNELDFVSDPMVRIQFSVGRKPRTPGRGGRGGGGGGGGGGNPRGRGRGQERGMSTSAGGGGTGPRGRGRGGNPGRGQGRDWRRTGAAEKAADAESQDNPL